jgi:hypothetical protein
MQTTFITPPAPYSVQVDFEVQIGNVWYNGAPLDFSFTLEDLDEPGVLGTFGTRRSGSVSARCIGGIHYAPDNDESHRLVIRLESGQTASLTTPIDVRMIVKFCENQT